MCPHQHRFVAHGHGNPEIVEGFAVLGDEPGLLIAAGPAFGGLHEHIGRTGIGPIAVVPGRAYDDGISVHRHRDAEVVVGLAVGGGQHGHLLPHTGGAGEYVSSTGILAIAVVLVSAHDCGVAVDSYRIPKPVVFNATGGGELDGRQKTFYLVFVDHGVGRSPPGQPHTPVESRRPEVGRRSGSGRQGFHFDLYRCGAIFVIIGPPAHQVHRPYSEPVVFAVSQAGYRVTDYEVADIFDVPGGNVHPVGSPVAEVASGVLLQLLVLVLVDRRVVGVGPGQRHPFVASGRG